MPLILIRKKQDIYMIKSFLWLKSFKDIYSENGNDENIKLFLTL